MVMVMVIQESPDLDFAFKNPSTLLQKSNLKKENKSCLM